MAPVNIGSIRHYGLTSSTDLIRTYFPRTPPPPIFEDADYPGIPTVEPHIDDQRFLGGAGASDANDGKLVIDGGTGPWATMDKALTELCGQSSWYCLNIEGIITVGASINTKSYGAGPGTSGQFVYIRPRPGFVATLDLDANITVDSQDYWLWYGFFIDSASAGIVIGSDLPTLNHTFRNILGTMTGLGGDNLGFLRSNPIAEYMGVFNCKFIGPGTAGVHLNTACLIAFRTDKLRWENNEVENAPRPLYFKHSNDVGGGAADVHIRRNWQLSGSSTNCFFAGRGNGGTFEIVDNIFENFAEISNGGGADQPDDMTIHHNTFVNSFSLQRGNDPVTNSDIRDNVIQADFGVLTGGIIDVNTNSSDYNLYGNDTINYQNSTYTLVQWRTNNPVASQDVNSLAGLPTFVGGGSPTTVSGYALDDVSLGKSAASDGSDMGADVSVVGNA